MLRKKNYKDEDHFTQYFSALLPRPNGSKLTFYFKRYRPAHQTNSTVYQTIHKNTKSNNEQKSQYPIDRTLEVISFDGDLEPTRNVFRKLGKIRKFVTGESKYQGKNVHYLIVIFKYEYDLVKCFMDEYLQNICNNAVTTRIKPTEEELQEQRRELISQHLSAELDGASKLQKLYQEGYNPVTNKFGEFKVDYEANQKIVEELPQTKRRQKMEQKRALQRSIKVQPKEEK